MYTDKKPTLDWWPSLLLSLNTIQQGCNEDTSVYHRRSPYERANLYSLPHFTLFLLLAGFSKTLQLPFEFQPIHYNFHPKTHTLSLTLFQYRGSNQYIHLGLLKVSSWIILLWGEKIKEKQEKESATQMNALIQLVQCRPEHCTGNTHRAK